jgi:hypothetical protein
MVSGPAERHPGAAGIERTVSQRGELAAPLPLLPPTACSFSMHESAPHPSSVSGFLAVVLV